MARDPKKPIEADRAEYFAEVNRRRCAACGAKFPPFGVSGAWYCREHWRSAPVRSATPEPSCGPIEKSRRRSDQGQLF